MMWLKKSVSKKTLLDEAKEQKVMAVKQLEAVKSAGEESNTLLTKIRDLRHENHFALRLESAFKDHR